ncbi:MAG TPA: energy transducer TonB [Chitinophagaceae bacterium]
MRTIFSSLFVICFLFSLNTSAQKIVKYYDNDWAETTSNKAVYYAEFVKEEGVYKCISYYLNSNIIRGRSIFQDTIMINAIGLQTLYNKKGKIEDSIYFEEGKAKNLYHYYPNGKLAVHYYFSANKKDAVTEAFDEEGNKIKNYIVLKDAEFKGGEKAWLSYLKKNTGKNLTGKDIANATVQVEFIVDESGGISKAKIFKSSGIKEIDQDALRVISESPEWNSAIMYNNPVKAYRLQPFNYSIETEKKSK